jgi:hypothetical protein
MKPTKFMNGFIVVVGICLTLTSMPAIAAPSVPTTLSASPQCEALFQNQPLKFPTLTSAPKTGLVQKWLNSIRDRYNYAAKLKQYEAKLQKEFSNGRWTQAEFNLIGINSSGVLKRAGKTYQINLNLVAGSISRTARTTQMEPSPLFSPETEIADLETIRIYGRPYFNNGTRWIDYKSVTGKNDQNLHVLSTLPYQEFEDQILAGFSQSLTESNDDQFFLIPETHNGRRLLGLYKLDRHSNPRPGSLNSNTTLHSLISVNDSKRKVTQSSQELFAADIEIQPLEKKLAVDYFNSGSTGDIVFISDRSNPTDSGVYIQIHKLQSTANQNSPIAAIADPELGQLVMANIDRGAVILLEPYKGLNYATLIGRTNDFNLNAHSRAQIGTRRDPILVMSTIADMYTLRHELEHWRIDYNDLLDAVENKFYDLSHNRSGLTESDARNLVLFINEQRAYAAQFKAIAEDQLIKKRQLVPNPSKQGKIKQPFIEIPFSDYVEEKANLITEVFNERYAVPTQQILSRVRNKYPLTYSILIKYLSKYTFKSNLVGIGRVLPEHFAPSR